MIGWTRIEFNLEWIYDARRRPFRNVFLTREEEQPGKEDDTEGETRNSTLRFIFHLFYPPFLFSPLSTQRMARARIDFEYPLNFNCNLYFYLQIEKQLVAGFWWILAR